MNLDYMVNSLYDYNKHLELYNNYLFHKYMSNDIYSILSDTLHNEESDNNNYSSALPMTSSMTSHEANSSLPATSRGTSHKPIKDDTQEKRTYSRNIINLLRYQPITTRSKHVGM